MYTILSGDVRYPSIFIFYTRTAPIFPDEVVYVYMYVEVSQVRKGASGKKKRNVQPYRSLHRGRTMVEGGWRRGRGGSRYYARQWSYDHRLSHPYNAGTKHVGFFTDREDIGGGGGGRPHLLLALVV